jgi:hypothetical protein
MEDLRYPIDAIESIGNIYTNSITMYTKEFFDNTKPILIQRGIIQGDTLSPYLFILFLKPLFRWLQRNQNGYLFHIYNTHESAVAYTNDLAPITNNIKAI